MFVNKACFNFCFSNLARERQHIYPRRSNATKLAHPLRQLLTLKDVVTTFSNNVLYNDGRIAVFNKPSGLSKSRSEGSPTSTDVFMDDVMKNSEKFVPGFSNPTIVKFPEKYSSGILIVAADEDVAGQVNKCKLRAKQTAAYFDKFLVICQGRPIKESANYRLAVRLAGNNDTKRKVRVLDESWANNEVKRQDVKLFRVAHQVLKSSDQASLCSVSISSTSKNSLRLYFATKLLAPLIGDIRFSSRVRDVLGVPMLLDPFSDVANSLNKPLPKQLLKALLLNTNETCLVPQCVHLAEVTLPSYSKEGHLVLSAPVPPTFKWVCQQLGILHEKLEIHDNSDPWHSTEIPMQHLNER